MSATTIASPPKPKKVKRLVYQTKKGAPSAYCYEVKPGQIEKKNCPNRLQRLVAKAAKTTASVTQTVCKDTGKIIKKTSIIWPIRLLLGLLDIIAAPYGKMKGRDVNFPLLWKAGAILLVLDVWLFFIIQGVGAKIVADRAMAAPHFIIILAQTLIPLGLGLGALSLIIGGIRLQQGKSFSNKYGAELEPLPAFESGIVFKIGDLKLSLRDMHTNVGAFGGIGTGKTVSVMVPLMRQFFQQLNHDTDDPKDEAQKVAALILDEKGDFIDSTIMEMILAGRPISDLVLIDPDLDLFRYNPLDPNQSADENAEKLGKVQKIIGGGGGGDNKYWDDTSKATIKYFLQLLEVYKPKEKIGLDDIARFMRDDQLATILCDEVEKTIEEKREANEINDETYGMIYDAVSATRNQWINLAQNTKSILKTTINQMLSNLASNPRLQKVFCRDTNFSFRDLPNKGKIVLFRGSGIDKSTAKLICVCLKCDFQTWQKRRNGSAASAYGLNTTRTVLFVCDEYQEFVTCGDEGDQTFYGVSRSARTCAIVATQSLNSLKGPIKNQEQTNTLIQNITTWIFLRTTDKDTMELGNLWAGQSKQEDYSTSQNTGGILEVASNMSGGSGKDSSVSISRKLEENFRKDDFSKLITMTMEKSKTGPWYSEAIVYHYHDTDTEAESRCYKTRLSHYYYTNDLRKQAGANVSHLDNLLYDRNWQRKTMQRALVDIARVRTKAADEKKKFLEKMAAAGKIPKPVSPEAERRSKLLAAGKASLEADGQTTDTKLRGQKMAGGLSPTKDLTPEDLTIIREKRHKLMADQANATSEIERKEIEKEIGRLNHMLAFSLLQGLSRSSERPGTLGKEVLAANKSVFSTPEETPEITEPAEPGETEAAKPPAEEDMWDPSEDMDNLEEFQSGISSAVLNPYEEEPEEEKGDQSTQIANILNRENQENPETPPEELAHTETEEDVAVQIIQSEDSNPEDEEESPANEYGPPEVPEIPSEKPESEDNEEDDNATKDTDKFL